MISDLIKIFQSDVFYDVFHSAIFIGIVGGMKLFKTRLLVYKIRDYSLEKIFLFAVTSIGWIIYGVFTDVHVYLLAFEGMATGGIMLAFIYKLNIDKSNTFFSKKVPGHGMPESRRAKIIKYVLLVLGIPLIIGVMILLAELFIN